MKSPTDLLNIDSFQSRFLAYTRDWDWEVEGFIDKKKFVYPIDLDTKVISTVFERLASPVVMSIAKEFGYTFELANQTTYPDFTLSRTVTPLRRIAVDIKTTYASNRMLFTLGGYNSFLRNETKNILYPYSTYDEHWIIGFVYRQNTPFPVYDLDSMPRPGEINCPYVLSALFIRHKHDIAGLRAGSGNTKNIGSVMVTDPFAFSTVQGPFTCFDNSKDACDHYWRHYEHYSSSISCVIQLINHSDFEQFGPIK